MLRGRSEQLAAIDRHLEGMRSGRAGALVLRGEAADVDRRGEPDPVQPVVAASDGGAVDGSGERGDGVEHCRGVEALTIRELAREMGCSPFRVTASCLRLSSMKPRDLIGVAAGR